MISKWLHGASTASMNDNREPLCEYKSKEISRWCQCKSKEQEKMCLTFWRNKKKASMARTEWVRRIINKIGVVKWSQLKCHSVASYIKCFRGSKTIPHNTIIMDTCHYNIDIMTLWSIWHYDPHNPYDIIGFSNPIKCTTPRVYVNNRFSMITFYQCRFIHCNKCTYSGGGVSGGKDCICVETGIIWELFIHFHSILQGTQSCSAKTIS